MGLRLGKLNDFISLLAFGLSLLAFGFPLFALAL
jgi:hypothetical protein